MPSVEFHSDPAIWVGEASNEMRPVIGDTIPGSCKACLNPSNVPGPCAPMPDVPYVFADITPTAPVITTAKEETFEITTSATERYVGTNGYKFPDGTPDPVRLAPNRNCAASECIWTGHWGFASVSERYFLRDGGFDATNVNTVGSWWLADVEIDAGPLFHDFHDSKNDDAILRDCPFTGSYITKFDWWNQTYQDALDRDNTPTGSLDSFSRTSHYSFTDFLHGYALTFYVGDHNSEEHFLCLVQWQWARYGLRNHEFLIDSAWRRRQTTYSAASMGYFGLNPASAGGDADILLVNDTGNMSLLYGIPTADVSDSFRQAKTLPKLNTNANEGILNTAPSSISIWNPFGWPVNA